MKFEEVKANLKKAQTRVVEIENILKKNLTTALDVDGLELSKENIKIKINLLATTLKEHFGDKPFVLVGILDGALPFTARLAKALERAHCNFQFTTIQASSYGAGVSAGTLKITSAPKISLVGERVVFADEVIDTGNTIYGLIEMCKEEAKSVAAVVLVDKKQPRAHEDYLLISGFTVSKDDFIVGLGLDIAGLLRNEEKVGIISAENMGLIEELKNLTGEINQLKRSYSETNLSKFSSFKPAPHLASHSAPIEELSTTNCNF